MKRAICVLFAGMLLLGAGYYSAVAANLEDPLDGTNLGVSGNVTYGQGWTSELANKAAVFSLGNDYIRYDKSYFAGEGTVSFFVKLKNAAGNSGKTLLDTVGKNGKAAGDFRVMISGSNTVWCGLWDATAGVNAWRSVTGTTALSNTGWAYVVLSYGSAGMKLWVNGASDGSLAYAGTRKANDIYAGDFLGDNSLASSAWSFAGSVDYLRTSNIQSDANLMVVPGVAAVPEPGSMLALMGGLLSAAAAFRRRR